MLLSLGLLLALRFENLRIGGDVNVPIPRRTGRFFGLLMAASLFVICAGAARADQVADVADAFYTGVRVGAMPVREDSGSIQQGLGALGFGDVKASADNSGTAGTLFVGYEFTAHAALEVGYTYRSSTAASLSGSIPSSSKLTPLLQDTSALVRGYGNIFSLDYSGRFEVLPRFSLEPRFGGFFWATKVTAVGFQDRMDATHEGGGVTAGLTGAYRVWRGLELGISIDHFHGFPSNIATLYAASLEWRFGK